MGITSSKIVSGDVIFVVKPVFREWIDKEYVTDKHHKFNKRKMDSYLRRYLDEILNVFHGEEDGTDFIIKMSNGVATVTVQFIDEPERYWGSTLKIERNLRRLIEHYELSRGHPEWDTDNTIVQLSITSIEMNLE
jgi:predicted component of type VI protein secretion system